MKSQDQAARKREDEGNSEELDDGGLVPSLEREAAAETKWWCGCTKNVTAEMTTRVSWADAGRKARKQFTFTQGLGEVAIG